MPILIAPEADHLANFLAPETAILAGSRPAGKIRCHFLPHHGLGLVRLNHKDAPDLQADGVPLKAVTPSWWPPHVTQSSDPSLDVD